MPIFLPNLTFEDELAGRRKKISAHSRRAMDELGPLMGLLATATDRVLVREHAEPDDLPRCLRHVQFATATDVFGEPSRDPAQLVPWGWTDAARQIASQAGMLPADIPSREAAVAVNRRSFLSDYDVVIDEGSHTATTQNKYFGQLCESTKTWKQGVGELQERGFDRWVAKPQISHAGRNRLLGTGCQLNDQQQGWLTRHMSQPGGVYLEPWVAPTEECGLQFEILRRKNECTTRLVGVTHLLNDHVGRYRGSLIGTDDRLADSWQEAIDHGHRICEAAFTVGYWGPLGIDAFRYLTPDQIPKIRLCNDINGRFTMGRLALQLEKWLQPDEFGLWLQMSQDNTDTVPFPGQNSLIPSTGIRVRTIKTSPRRVGRQHLRLTTVLAVAKSPEALKTFALNLETNGTKTNHD